LVLRNSAIVQSPAGRRRGARNSSAACRHRACAPPRVELHGIDALIIGDDGEGRAGAGRHRRKPGARRSPCRRGSSTPDAFRPRSTAR
jgi:hypothetical protein